VKPNTKNQRRSYFEVQQPFDLFEEMPAVSSQQLYKKSLPRRPVSTKIWAIVGFFSLIAIGAWVFFAFHQREVKHPFVFVELRAVTPKGNPLAGAQVQLGEQKMGVTDSFGEWRRYLRLRPGSKIRVRMTKAYQGYNFEAENTLKVPLHKPDGREVELKTSLSLQLHEQKNTASKVAVSADVRQSSSSNFSARQSQLGNQFQIRNSYLSQNHLTSIDIRHVKFESQSGSLMESHQSGVLRNRIIPELIAQIDEQGIRMDRQAGWKFLLSYIPYQDQVGFIRGELIWRDHKGRPQKNSFMATFAKTVEESARSLLQMAKRQVTKQYGASFFNGNWYLADIQEPAYWRLSEHTGLLDPTGVWLGLRPAKDSEGRPVWQLVGREDHPCKNIPQTDECPVNSPSLREIAPQPSWTVQPLQVVGVLPDRAEIYVSGYQAYPVRANQWAYWGDAATEVMVTVIHNQRIYHRVRLPQPTIGQALILTLPGQTAQYTPPKMPRRL